MTTIALPTEVTAGVEIITPELAQKYLTENYQGQRRISPVTIRRYSRAMKEGKWMLTGEPILFDWNGKMYDGQHRCRAVVEAEVPVAFLVARGFNPDSFKFVDIGKKRTSSDILTILGIDKGTADLGAVYKVMNAYAVARATKRGLGEVIKNTTLENHEFDMWVARYDPFDILEFVTLARGMCEESKALHSRSAVAAALYIADHNGLADSEEFARSMIAGANLPEGDSRLLLRRKDSVLGSRNGGSENQAVSFVLTANALQGKRSLHYKTTLTPDLGNV